MAKKRLDVLLFEKGFCPSRERAKTAIMEGIVYIAGQKAGKAGDMVDENAELEVRGNENAFVSRGGKKIEKALNYFNIDPTDLDRKSTRLNSSHGIGSRMPSSA